MKNRRYVRRVLRIAPFWATFLCILAWNTAVAQNAPRYLILFQDKLGTPFSTESPENFLSERAIERRVRQQIAVSEVDLPVNPVYIAAVQNTGATVLHPTKWFNGVVVSASEAQIAAIRLLPFFKGIERDMALTNANYSGRIGFDQQKFGTQSDIDYGNSRTQLDMLGVPDLHQAGYTGEGMLIGVFDSGFTRADQQGYLGHLFTNEQIVDTYDFFSRDANVYDDHSHGLQVLSVMAAKSEGSLVGGAFDARYALYRTENVFSETPYEEVAWLLAAERADSLGVDIINTSLGYYDFDNPAHNYTYAQMDGRTTIISRAARFAARTGILLVTSAGNEGSNSWRYISAPADVDSVFSIGAVTSTGVRSSFSSFGPNAEGTIKPDVVALGSGVRVGTTSGGTSNSNGTSFSSPLIASFAALVWQLHPNKTAQDIAALIRSWGSQANSPDTILGYGIPRFNRSFLLAAPENFVATLAGNLVLFSWDVDEDVMAYEIERAEPDGQFVKIATVTGSDLPPADTLTAGGTFRYRIRALTDSQNSAYSATSSVEFIVTGSEQPFTTVTARPNPASGRITLQIGSHAAQEALRAEFISPAGLLIRSLPLSIRPDGSAELPLNGLTSGLYILRLSSSLRQIKPLKIVVK